MARKTGYSATMICGSTAAGDPLPPHFQLKYEATAKWQRLNIDHIANYHDVLGRFGFDDRGKHPCTFGMNKQTGMYGVEIEEYIRTEILPLYPDAAGVPGKRVIMKVDSGPGSSNIEMLARLRLLGCYLILSVPNTTQLYQETNQGHGIFKSKYRINLRKLATYRFALSKTLNISDLALIVFVETVSEDCILVNAFQLAFSVAKNNPTWLAVGACPVTRACLESKIVRHQVVRDSNGVCDVDADYHSELLLHVEVHNKLCCGLLSSRGFDSDQLREKAPSINPPAVAAVAVTE